jgi:uncharacterized protein YbaR (Trm112 family)
MFIEVTDLLRCPAAHDESYLVLIPDAVRDRLVEWGRLGCPACGREFPIEAGVARFGPVEPVRATLAGPAAEGVHALLGLDGPGGYVALAGTAARYAADLATLLPGVHLVGVDAPDGTRESDRLSLVEAPRLPLKTGAVRGIVLGEPFGGDPVWQADAVRAVLPGLRVVGSGRPPSLAGFELMGEAAGWWVGRRRG